MRVYNKNLGTGADALAYYRLDRIMNAYTDDRPFSIDLVGAVSSNPRSCSQFFT